MSKLILPAEYMSPVIVTYAQLRQTLWPYIWNYKWAIDTLGDLWRLCTPTPETIVGNPNEKRILNPGQFRKWWAEICGRQALDLQVSEVFSRKVKVL